MKRLVSFVLLGVFVWSCATAPYTGRRQVILVSEGQEISLGDDAYKHALRDSVITHNPDAERIVRKVGERIAAVANKPEYKWEFTVINDPEMVNAFAVPGGKVAAYTGIFGPARDEAGLAVVLGHEVAHALARHPAERMSQDMLLQLGGVGLGIALGKNPAMANQVLQAYGIVGGVGVALPFGRSQETEADRIGLILMAKAGYDPRVAVDLWQRMETMEKKEAAKGRPPEFLSTHPGYETRVQNIRSFLPEALSYYQPSNARLETLPSPESLDTPAAKSERELLKRMEAINQRHRAAERRTRGGRSLGLRVAHESPGDRSGAPTAPNRLRPVRGVARRGLSRPRLAQPGRRRLSARPALVGDCGE